MDLFDLMGIEEAPAKPLPPPILPQPEKCDGCGIKALLYGSDNQQRRLCLKCVRQMVSCLEARGEYVHPHYRGI